MTTDLDLVAGPVFALRTPLLPFDEIEAWSRGLPSAAMCATSDQELAAALAADRSLLRERLRAAVAQPEIREALFLASPDLEGSLPQWLAAPESKKGQRTEHGLVRYLLRMASRPTPFGLFSGCTTGGLGAESCLTLSARAHYQRHSRLDMDYLFALCEQLSRGPQARAELRYHPNPSLSAIAGRLRYAEARVEGRLRTYHLVAIDPFPALTETLDRAAGGACLEELARALVASDPEGEIELDEALAFVGELVDHQLLLPELAPLVTGEESTPDLTRTLRGLSFAREAGERLAGAAAALAAIDGAGLGTEPELYRTLAADLEPLGTPVEISRLIQVDLVKPKSQVLLGPRVLAEVRRGIALLHRLHPPRVEGRLDEFRSAFRERYGEGREVPLMAALDEESGVGFERANAAAAEASPLLLGLPFASKAERSTTLWDRREVALLRLLTRALATQKTTIELSEADLEALANAEPPPLPDAFHAMVTLAAGSGAALDAGDFELYLAHAGGPSGARILGRFCHADEELCAGVEEHLRAEEALAPDAIFAEVVHLPAGRIGNILARPLLRTYEIPYLGRSGAPPERQIAVSDLMVTVIGERIRLRSLSRDREVIPRLTTAHNTARESLGLYRFLSAVQGQGRAGTVQWNWGPFEAAPFLPRITEGRLVLSKATWRLSREEIESLAKPQGNERARRLRSWREERQIPRFTVLADGDNELLIDSENALCQDSWLELIKNREEAVLRELFPHPDRFPVRGPEGRFTHELVIPFVRRPSAPPHAAAAPLERQAPERTPAAAPERSFIPGSRWLYAKLYTGTATADALLRDIVDPLVARARDNGWIERWFFIRYGDPDWHLRLRFAGDPRALTGALLPELTAAVAPLLADGSVRKLQLDTYEREIERYGGPAGIELAEELFWHDSTAVVAVLGSLAGDAGADLRWRLMLCGMDRLLADFGYDPEGRRRIAERARTGFASRYRPEPLRPAMADRLRREKATLERLLGGAEPLEPLREGLAALEHRSRNQATLVAELGERARRGLLNQPLADIVPSLLHMFVNRLARSHGPEHELVLYDFLVQLYGSELARGRGKAKVGREPEAELVGA